MLLESSVTYISRNPNIYVSSKKLNDIKQKFDDMIMLYEKNICRIR